MEDGQADGEAARQAGRDRDEDQHRDRPLGGAERAGPRGERARAEPASRGGAGGAHPALRVERIVERRAVLPELALLLHRRGEVDDGELPEHREPRERRRAPPGEARGVDPVSVGAAAIVEVARALLVAGGHGGRQAVEREAAAQREERGEREEREGDVVAAVLEEDVAAAEADQAHQREDVEGARLPPEQEADVHEEDDAERGVGLTGAGDGVEQAPHLLLVAQVEEVVVVRKDAVVGVELLGVDPAAEQIAEEHRAEAQAEEPEGTAVDAEKVIPERLCHVHLVPTLANPSREAFNLRPGSDTRPRAPAAAAWACAGGGCGSPTGRRRRGSEALSGRGSRRRRSRRCRCAGR